MTSEEIIATLKSRRRDAEGVHRDPLPGISMLRGWLRGLHIDIVLGHDAAQDMSQDEIAERLGEYPRGHHFAFKVRDPRDDVDMSADYGGVYGWPKVLG